MGWKRGFRLQLCSLSRLWDLLVLFLSLIIDTVDRTNTSSSTLVPHIDQIDLV